MLYLDRVQTLLLTPDALDRGDVLAIARGERSEA
jgi:hypothetical protein